MVGPLRILITDQNFGDEAAVERELVEAAGAELAVEGCEDEDDVARALETHRPDAILVQFAPVGARALSAANGLRAIVRYGVGVDNIDTAAAEERGIAVGRVPDYCVAEVADHTIALLLAVERGIVTLARQTAEGGWDWHEAGRVRRLDSLTLGLVGFGRIARAVALRAEALGLRVVAHDPEYDRSLPLDELLPQSDVVSVHVPLTDETRGVIGERELALLPEGAIVLNTARGGLVDENALLEALRSGRLGGAGLDVLEEEPPPQEHPLRTAPRVVLTPHAAWFSDAAVLDLRRKAVETALELVAR